MTMRNRKTIVTAFVLAACMLIGVGYAVLSDSLRIDGTVSIDHANVNKAFDELVYFASAAPVKDDRGTAYGSDETPVDTASVSNTEGTENDIVVVGVHSPTFADDVAYFKVTIKNDYEKNVYVKPKIDTSSAIFDSTLVKISSSWTQQGSDSKEYGAIHEIEAGGQVEYILQVKLLKTIDSGIANTNFAIGMDVSDTLSSIKTSDDTFYIDSNGAQKTIE